MADLELAVVRHRLEDERRGLVVVGPPRFNVPVVVAVLRGVEAVDEHAVAREAAVGRPLIKRLVSGSLSLFAYGGGGCGGGGPGLIGGGGAAGDGGDGDGGGGGGGPW